MKYQYYAKTETDLGPWKWHEAKEGDKKYTLELVSGLDWMFVPVIKGHTLIQCPDEYKMLFLTKEERDLETFNRRRM